MNLMIIGDDVDKIAKDIWKANTNYYIINQNPYVFDKNFIKFIKNKRVIVCTTVEQFEDKDFNTVVDFMNDNKFIPIFVTDSNETIENRIYIAIDNYVENCVLYLKNEKNEDYDNLIKICGDYLLGKGLINNDTTLRTSGEGKKTSSRK